MFSLIKTASYFEETNKIFNLTLLHCNVIYLKYRKFKKYQHGKHFTFYYQLIILVTVLINTDH